MRILYLEDNPEDAVLVQMRLKNELPECEVIWVDTKNKFEEALLNSGVELVLSDYALPGYNGLAALEYTHTHQPSLPFILISGTIGEEKTIEIFEAGVTDFILKDTLDRLKPSIVRALNAAEAINKRALAEQALKKSNEELLQFVHIASHDLKAPMIAVDRLASWIEEDCADNLSDEAKQHLQLLRQRVNRMFHLIDGISQYAQASRVTFNLQQIDVKKVLDDVIDTLNPPKAFSIQYPDKLPTLQAVEGLLSLVFSNLISNSIQHHHQKTGHINISVNDSGHFYTFCVTDDGPGIEPAYHDKVFQMFQTLQARDILDTAGMGLSIVKKIVDSQGGQITLDSEKGKGAKFCFTWPKGS